MKNLIIIAGLIACTTASSQNQTWDWARYPVPTNSSHQCSTGGYYYQGGPSVVADSAGNSYVTGMVAGAFQLGTLTVNTLGAPNAFLAKYDPSGVCLWVRNFGLMGGTRGVALALDPAGYVYLAGVISGQNTSLLNVGTVGLVGGNGQNVFLMKFTFGGTPVWARQASSNTFVSNYPTSIAIDGAGSCYITGFMHDYNVTNFGNVPIMGPGSFIVRYDSTGNMLLAKKIANNCTTTAVNVDQGGNILLSGHAHNTGTLYTTPPSTIATIGGKDVFVAKLNSSGSFLWTRHFGSPGVSSLGPEAFGNDIGTDNSGNIYITGHFDDQLIIGSDTLDVPSGPGKLAFLTKLDPNGNPLWAKQTVAVATLPQSEAHGRSIKVMGDGSMYLAGGCFSGTLNGMSFGSEIIPHGSNTKLFVMHLDPGGNPLWSKYSTGNGLICQPAGIALDGPKNVFVSATLKDTIVIGSDVVVSKYETNFFVAKLNNSNFTGIGKHSITPVSIFPNPFTGHITIQTDQSLHNFKLAVYDVSGKKVSDQNIPEARGKVQVQLDLQPGIYFYRLTNENSVLQQGKLVSE